MDIREQTCCLSWIWSLYYSILLTYLPWISIGNPCGLSKPTILIRAHADRLFISAYLYTCLYRRSYNFLPSPFFRIYLCLRVTFSAQYPFYVDPGSSSSLSFSTSSGIFFFCYSNLFFPFSGTFSKNRS